MQNKAATKGTANRDQDKQFVVAGAVEIIPEGLKSVGEKEAGTKDVYNKGSKSASLRDVSESASQRVVTLKV
jgi:hypothetical protein